MLSLHGVRFSPLLDPVTLEVGSGERVAILGEENSGKSVLFRTMSGLLAPLAGQVVLDGRPMAQWSARERASRLGVLFGNPDPFFLATTVWEEVALGAANLGVLGRGLEERVEEALTHAGLPLSVKGENIGALAVSQRYRVALAAVLACRPRLLLAEEPGMLLSDKGEAALAETFVRLNQQLAMTMITVTNRQGRGRLFAQRLVVLAS